jgi:hypothetical protein
LVVLSDQIIPNNNNALQRADALLWRIAIYKHSGLIKIIIFLFNAFYAKFSPILPDPKKKVVLKTGLFPVYLYSSPSKKTIRQP